MARDPIESARMRRAERLRGVSQLRLNNRVTFQLHRPGIGWIWRREAGGVRLLGNGRVLELVSLSSGRYCESGGISMLTIDTPSILIR